MSLKNDFETEQHRVGRSILVPKFAAPPEGQELTLKEIWVPSTSGRSDRDHRSRSGSRKRSSGHRRKSSSSRRDRVRRSSRDSDSMRRSSPTYIPAPRRRSSDSRINQTQPSRVSRFLVALSVVMSCAVGVGISYGVFLLTKQPSQTASTVAVSNNGSNLSPSDRESNSGDFASSDTGNMEPTNIARTPNQAVWFNSDDCGTLGKGISDPHKTQSHRYKRDLQNDLPRHEAIVGGEDAILENHPWQVSLWTTKQEPHGGDITHHTCGGAIIASNWIIFAAHCAEPFPFPHHWKLYAGVENRNAMPMLAQSATVTDVIAHTQFTTATYNNDVALIRIKENLTFNLKVRPICLPPNNHHFLNGTLCRISGWGAKKEGQGMPDMFQDAWVRVISRETCNSDEWLMGMVSNMMLCAGTVDGSRDACQGDSGGPLSCYDETTKKYLLVGIVSWGIGCGEPFMPGVYTDLSKYAKWISDVMHDTEATYH